MTKTKQRIVLRDLFWPWGTNRRLRAQLKLKAQRIHWLENEIERRKDCYFQQASKRVALSIKLAKTRQRVNQLESLLANAHFRNPATGRLWPKGRLPEGVGK